MLSDGASEQLVLAQTRHDLDEIAGSEPDIQLICQDIVPGILTSPGPREGKEISARRRLLQCAIEL